MCPLATPHLVCHCMLIELGDRLVLVESGYGSADVQDTRVRLGSVLPHLFRATLSLEETAIAQVRALGFDPKDVRDVVLTHMDTDHIGGISDFPWATIHVTEREHHGVFESRRRAERVRYGRLGWARDAHFARYEPAGGEPWFGFECVRDLQGLPPELLLLPLRGHTPGHAGVAVQGPDGWLLHCGDAYYHHGEMETEYRCPWPLRLFQQLSIDNAARLHNQQRLRALVAEHGSEVSVFCAHDRSELRRELARAQG